MNIEEVIKLCYGPGEVVEQRDMVKHTADLAAVFAGDAMAWRDEAKRL